MLTRKQKDRVPLLARPAVRYLISLDYQEEPEHKEISISKKDALDGRRTGAYL
jgi:hypothetical protein